MHKRFLKFYESVLKSSDPVVKLCGQLVLSASRSMVCKNLNHIWSKYNMSLIASKSDKDSYSTMTSMLHTYEKEKYETYDIND